MDAVQGIAELVAEDHRLIDALFRQFEGAGGRAIAAQICEALDQHASAEERFVDPALREGVADGSYLAGKATEARAHTKQLVKQISETSDEKALSELVGELHAAVARHVAAEEGTLLPKMDSDLGLLDMDIFGAGSREFKSFARSAVSR